VSSQSLSRNELDCKIVPLNGAVSPNNTAKKREIFEGMAKPDSLDRNSLTFLNGRLSGTSEKSKIEDAVAEIKDILSRYFPFIFI